MKTKLHRIIHFLAWALLASVTGSAQTASKIDHDTVRIVWPTSNGVVAYIAVRFDQDFPNGATQATPVYGATTTGGTYDYNIPEGESVYVSFFCNPTWNGTNAIVTGPFAWEALEYSIKFTIPANPSVADGGVVQHYQIRNGAGEVLSEYNSIPGDPQTEITITGLETDERVYLVRLEGKYVGFTDENGVYTTIFIPSGAVSLTDGIPGPSTGTPPTVAAPETPTPTQPLPPLPTPTPVAPIPTTAPSTPTATTPVAPRARPGLPTPTGTGGATKADLETVGNQLEVAVRDGADDTVNASAKIVEAVDKVAAAVADGTSKTVVAVDKVSTAVWENGKAVVSSVDTVVVGVTKANENLGLINDRLKGHGTKLDSVVSGLASVASAVNSGPSRAADEAAAAAATTQATADGLVAKTAAQASV